MGLPFDEDEFYNEWAWRPPTIAEAWSHAQRTWEGERCEHEFALLPFGPDVTCGACEADAYYAALADEPEDALP